MKRIIIYLSAVYFFCAYPTCPAPTEGSPVWNAAVTALDLIITTEIILDSLLDTIAIDISGIYTVANSIDTSVTSAQVSMYNINSMLDDFVGDIAQTQSKLVLLESQLTTLNTIIDQISTDITRTYTALDTLQTIIISELGLLTTQLETVQMVITDITTSAIDHNVTVASKLDILQIDVKGLNSVLDSINWPNLNTSLDTLSSLIDILAKTTNSLQDTIQTGFAQTFTALNTQLSEADIIESIIQNIHIHNTIDLSGVFTALQSVDATINAIESIVDIITLINAKNTAIETESLMDISVSLINVIESKIAPLPSIADHTISMLEFVDLALLDQASSKLDLTLTELDSIESLSDTISSKLSEVIIDNHNNFSALAIVASRNITIASDLDSFDLPSSKLQAINSYLDVDFTTEHTIESLIDVLFNDLITINSALDPLATEAQLINSLLATIELVDTTISSKLDLTINNLRTVNSTLDQISNTSASSLASLRTVESYLDRTNSMFDALAITSIESKLAITSSLENSVISKLDVIIPFVATLNNEAQGLINDFQSTWTILNKINTSLATSQTTLTNIESTLEHFKISDLSTVFTVIDTIVRNEATVNSQVDVYNSMVDAFTRLVITDFNGVFTALNSITTSSNLLSGISSKLTRIQTEFGFPIYTNQLPLTIATSGRYYLAENINYNGASNAITINANNVSIDLNSKILNYTGASSVTAITINGVDNTRIFGGTVNRFSNFAVNASGGPTNILVYDLVTDSGIAYSASTRNSIVTNSLFNGSVAGDTIRFVGINHKIKNCIFSNSAGFATRNTYSNIEVSNCLFFQTSSANAIFFIGSVGSNCVIEKNTVQNMTTGLREDSGTVVTGAIIKDNVFLGGNLSGITPQSGSEWVIKNNDIISCVTGINNSGTPSNFFVGFNNLVQNTGGNILLQGANTYLGNFAFNTNATGTPPNTNFNLTGSSITGKYVTGSQRGSFGDFPDKWHNINMLP